LPINVLSLGFSTLFVNAGMLLLTSALIPNAVVTDVPSAFFASLVLSFVNILLTGLFAIGGALSCFQNIVERLSRTERARSTRHVSNNFHDAAEINARYSRGQGLLRGRSSINNMTAGDAAKSLLTMSTLDTNDEQVKRARTQDLYLFFVNPYAFKCSLLLTLWDVVELGEALRQTILNGRLRLNRLHKAYPLVRAVTNVFLRDLGTYLVTLDIIRGLPAIYTTYVGYDEVAHHAGPATSDALRTLRELDRAIRRIRDVIVTKAPRPAGLHYAAALSHELQNVEAHALGGRIGKHTIQGTRHVIAQIEKPQGLADPSGLPV
jgi:hypothetical protein